jgi:hypothetical protein
MIPDKIFSYRNTVILCALVFLIYLVYRVALIFYPTQDAGGVEGNILYFIQRLLDGQPFYTDPEQAPYAIAQYSPMYYFIVSTIAKLTGVGPEDLLALFSVNRAVSLILNLGYILIVFRICKNIFLLSAGSSFAASALCFIFLEITSYARPDSLHHLLFMSTLYLFMGAIKKEEAGQRNTGLFILSAVLAAIALFAKQTSFVLPVVIGAWLLMQKNFGGLLKFGSIYVITVGVCLVIVDLTLGLSLFYKNAVLGINNGISISWFKSAVINFFYLRFGLFFIAAFILLLFLMRKETGRLLHFSKTILFLLFLLLNFIALKNGSNSGYLTEWWTLVIILSCYYAGKLYSKGSRGRLTFAGMLLWLAIVLKPVLMYPAMSNTVSPAARSSALAYFKTQQKFADRIKQLVSATDKYVLFLNIYTPDSYLCNLLFCNTAAPQMDILTLASYPRKKFDYTDFEKSLTDGRIKWMVMQTTGPQKQFFSIKMDKFELAGTEAGFNLYQYKP